MAEKTGISWCDATWNPWWGCQKVSPACDHCYAERDAKRFAAGRTLWGTGSERRIFDIATEAGAKHWKAPLTWAKTMPAKLGRRPRVFSASMGDWLDLDAPLSEFVRLLDTIRRTPELDWLLLSKRIGNWRKRIDEAREAAYRSVEYDLTGWIGDWQQGRAPANVWLGATVIDQDEADRDVPKLLVVPARVRFLSIEPMLGPVDLTYLPGQDRWRIDALRGVWERHNHSRAFDEEPNLERNQGGPRLHWVIAGGESGQKARPAHPDWFRSLRDQCAGAGVPFHFKQWGEWAPDPDDDQGVRPIGLTKAGQVLTNNAAFNAHAGDAELMLRIGKAAAGRLLDGVEHNAFPEVA